MADFKTHGRPEGKDGELYDKLVNSKGAKALRDALLILCNAFEGTEGAIGAVTKDGQDLVVIDITKWKGTTVDIQNAVDLDNLDEVCKDLNGEQLIEEAAVLIARALANANIQINK